MGLSRPGGFAQADHLRVRADPAVSERFAADRLGAIRSVSLPHQECNPGQYRAECRVRTERACPIRFLVWSSAFQGRVSCRNSGGLVGIGIHVFPQRDGLFRVESALAMSFSPIASASLS